jgi:hypothetical protein
VIRLLLATLGLVALAAAPSYAAPTGSVSTGDGVLYDGCRAHAFDYAVTPAGEEWELDVRLLAPDGTQKAVGYEWGATRGTDTFTFCDGDQPGTWTVTATLVDYVDGKPAASTPLPSATFTMRAPQTRVTVSRSRAGHGTAVRVRASTETADGWEPETYAPVRLQRRTAQGWRTVLPGQLVTDDRGVATVRVPWRGRVRAELR